MSPRMGREPEAWDAVVVGGGPAGLSAAAWLARYRRKVLVLDAGEHRNRWVELGHGYLGFDPFEPGRLLDRARSDLSRYPLARLRSARVVSARPVGRAGGPRFSLAVADGEDGEGHATVLARRVVLATGVEDVFPEVEGFFEHYGANVFHCPTCDGYEAQDRRVAVFGWSEDVAGFALNLLDWAAAVTVVTAGRPFEGEALHRQALTTNGVPLVEDDAVALEGRRGSLQAVRLRSGARLACEMAFFSIAHRPVTVLADQLGCALGEEGCVVVDHEGLTTVPGVYAAGDLTPGVQLVQVAAAKGTVAGVHCALSLRGERAMPGGPEPGPDVGTELRAAARRVQDEQAECGAGARGKNAGMSADQPPAAPEATSGPSGPDPQRLDQLDEHIEEVRHELQDLTGEDQERTFIEPGSRGPVDDTIAPPG